MRCASAAMRYAECADAQRDIERAKSSFEYAHHTANNPRFDAHRHEECRTSSGAAQRASAKCVQMPAWRRAQRMRRASPFLMSAASAPRARCRYRKAHVIACKMRRDVHLPPRLRGAACANAARCSFAQPRRRQSHAATFILRRRSPRHRHATRPSPHRPICLQRESAHGVC